MYDSISQTRAAIHGSLKYVTLNSRTLLLSMLLCDGCGLFLVGAITSGRLLYAITHATLNAITLHVW